MRIAIISDIHGNAVAFDGSGRAAPRNRPDRLPDDAIQGGPQPADVVARLRALAAPS
jgi:hypothetical protein